MSSLFNELLYKPLFNALVFLYETVAFFDLGIAIIILTLIIRFALYPLSQKAINSQKEMFKIQPEIKRIQEKYKDNKEEQVKRIMNLYKEKNVNPLSGCLPILIQIPILLALYWVFLDGFNSDDFSEKLYSFIKAPEQINYMFLGVIDISERNLFIAFLAGLFQFVQSKMLLNQQIKSRKERILKEKPKKNQAENKFDDISLAVSKQMTYVMPILTVLIAGYLHAGIALYWATTTLFSAVQQWYVFNKKDNSKNQKEQS